MRAREAVLWGSVHATLLLATAELAVRVLQPTPRVQVVTGSEPPDLAYAARVVGTEPLWAAPGSTERQNAGCERPRRVVLFGSSILFGTSLDAPEAVSTHLQSRLDAAEPGAWCVHNHAQPAYVGESKLIEAERLLPALQPELVLWELWDADPGRYTFVGTDAYNFVGLRLGADGLPWVLPLPSALHGALFRQSAFYRYATLAMSPTDGRDADALGHAYLDVFEPRMEALRARWSGRLVLVRAPHLDQPFATWADRPLDAHQRRLASWAAAHDVPIVSLAEALRSDHVEALRLDTCCHFNAAGHERLADVLLPVVRPPEAEAP